MEIILSGLINDITICLCLAERYVIGVGETTSKEILHREVIHRLSLGPNSRSQLVKSLPCKDPEDVSRRVFL